MIQILSGVYQCEYTHCQTPLPSTSFFTVTSNSASITVRSLQEMITNMTDICFIKDRFAKQRREPIIDPVQDWQVLSSKEVNGYTVFKIRRDIQANEKDIDLDIPVS